MDPALWKKHSTIMRSWSFLRDYVIYVNMSRGTFYKLLVFYDLLVQCLLRNQMYRIARHSGGMLCSKQTDLLSEKKKKKKKHRNTSKPPYCFVCDYFHCFESKLHKNRPYNKCYVRLQQYQAKAIWHSPTVICDFKSRK